MCYCCRARDSAGVSNGCMRDVCRRATCIVGKDVSLFVEGTVVMGVITVMVNVRVF